LLFSACAQKVNDPADVQAIKNLYVEFDKADMANDTAWFTSAYFLDGAVRMPPNEAMLTGKEAISKQIQMDHDKNTPVSEVSSVDEVLSSGDLAIARGSTHRRGPEGEWLGTITEQGKWVATLRRQSDGKWKCVHEIWNSDQPAPGSTASGEDEQALLQIERDWAEASVRRMQRCLTGYWRTSFRRTTQLCRQQETVPRGFDEWQQQDRVEYQQRNEGSRVW